MAYVEKFKAALDNLEEKTILTYCLAIVGIIFTLLLMMTIYYFYARHGWYTDIDELNQLRQNKVRRILAREAQFQQQQKEARELLAKEPDFKLAGYLEKVLGELSLKSTREEFAPETDKGISYVESSIDFSLNGINMMQLVKLLQKFEENKRIYIKKLEIMRSKLTPHALEVNMTIATLLPK